MATMEIIPIVKRGVIAWNVQVSGETVRVELSELPAPSFPTAHQIRHVASRKSAGIPSDQVALAQAIDEVLSVELAYWEQSETVRKHCVKLANVDWKKAKKIEDSYLDRTSVIGFDDAAMSAAYEIPELGWKPSDDNGQALWEIVSREPKPRPKRTDLAILNSAYALIESRKAEEAIPF